MRKERKEVMAKKKEELIDTDAWPFVDRVNRGMRGSEQEKIKTLQKNLLATTRRIRKNKRVSQLKGEELRRARIRIPAKIRQYNKAVKKWGGPQAIAFDLSDVEFEGKKAGGGSIKKKYARGGGIRKPKQG